MQKKLRFFVLFLLFIIVEMYSQSRETCNNSVDDPVFDLNSITKCSVQKAKDNKVQKVSVEVTTRRRVVRKRNKAKGLASNDHSHELASIKKKIDVVNNIIDVKKDVPDILPFDYVDQIPLFEKCEKVPLLAQERCFKLNVLNHIKRNLKYPKSAYARKVQGKVYVHFVINKEGKVDELKIVSPYKGELLGKEAERIIKKLPKFKPGKHNGSPVVVKYGLPITFKIPGVKPSNIRKNSNKSTTSETIYSFSTLDFIPQFKTCEKLDDTSMTCFNSNLIQHIQSYFAYPEEAKTKNIEGNVVVNFVIDKKGNVTNITSKGPENTEILELAAIRFIEKLPQFIPGKRDGKNVNTSYSFPINFKIN